MITLLRILAPILAGLIALDITYFIQSEYWRKLSEKIKSSITINIRSSPFIGYAANRKFVVGIFLVGVVFSVLGAALPSNTGGNWPWLINLFFNLLTDLSPEFVGISIGVLAIDYWNKIRQEEQLKAQLIREMGGPDNGFARRAAREMEHYKYLSDGSLIGKNLGQANLSSVDLRGADLRGANLILADLYEADLRRANLNEANLNLTNLSRADLTWTKLEGAMLDDTTQIADKWRLVWEIVTQGAERRNLSGADLHWTNLSGANLNGVDLSEANLSLAILRGVDLRGANLSRTVLSGADLRGAFLFNASLVEADLSKAPYNDDTKWPEGFDPKAVGAINVDEEPQ